MGKFGEKNSGVETVGGRTLCTPRNIYYIDSTFSKIKIIPNYTTHSEPKTQVIKKKET